MSLFYSDENVKKQLLKLEENVSEGKTSPFKAAKELISTFKS
jgi:hypothetical protein